MIEVETLGKIKESCDVYTPLGLAMAGRLLQEVPVSFNNAIIEHKMFEIKMPYDMKQKSMGVTETIDMISTAIKEIIPYFKELNERFHITITKVDTAINEIGHTYRFMFDYVLERKQ